MQALNNYDYFSGKSAQEAISLIDKMEEIFSPIPELERLLHLVKELVFQYETIYGCETPLTEEIALLIGE